MPNSREAKYTHYRHLVSLSTYGLQEGPRLGLPGPKLWTALQPQVGQTLAPPVQALPTQQVSHPANNVDNHYRLTQNANTAFLMLPKLIGTIVGHADLL